MMSQMLLTKAESDCVEAMAFGALVGLLSVGPCSDLEGLGEETLRQCLQLTCCASSAARSGFAFGSAA